MESHFIKIQEQTIHYIKRGDNGPVIIILHGWGVSSAHYHELILTLTQQGYMVYALDLPGFGKSPEPQLIWNFDNYTQLVLEFIKMMHIKQYTVIGHSFGGGIAIYIASKSPTGMLGVVLCAPRSIIHKKTVRQSMTILFAKAGNTLFSLPGLNSLKASVKKYFYKVAHARDYERASPKMKLIMKQIIQTDLTPLFSKIEIPTLLIWGRKDQSTPIEDAQKIIQKIPHARFIELINENHGFVYKSINSYISDLLVWLKEQHKI